MFFQKRGNNYGQRSFVVHLIIFITKYFCPYQFHNVVTKTYYFLIYHNAILFGPMKWSSHLIQGLKA